MYQGVKQATNYKPDPDATRRYYAPYEQIKSPVNNGALQDSDGFVIDLAQGEDRANEVIEQRQLTPGTWTNHDAMPERPMPFSQQNFGYQPVGSKTAKGPYHSWWSDGEDRSRVPTLPIKSWEQSQADHGDMYPNNRTYMQDHDHGPFACGHNTPCPWPVRDEPCQAFEHMEPHKKCEDCQTDDYRESQKKTSSFLDKEGFLVESDEKAPYRLKEEGGRWFVVNKDGEKKEEKGYSSKGEARQHQKALYANVPGAAESAEEDEKKKGKTSSFDKEGFLVEAGDYPGGRANQPLQDPVPGAPTRVNPYYFSGGPEGLGGDNPDFPQDPAPVVEDRVNELYGDVAPAQSQGDTSPTSDGKGYSRSQGSRNFNVTAVDRPPRFKPGDRVIDFRGESGTVHTVYPSPSTDKSHKVRVVYDGETEPSHPYYEHVFDHHPDIEDELAHAVDNAVPHEDDLRRAYASMEGKCQCEHSDHFDEDGPRKSHEYGKVASGKYKAQHVGPVCDRCAMDHVKEYLRGKTGTTNGRIVKACPGCGDRLREHQTPHGVELHHLGNDHVRCHGSKQGELSNGNVRTADYLGRPDARNPTGRGDDEYRAGQWDAYEKQRPLQRPEERNINTPVLPNEPIRKGPDVNTPQEAGQRKDEDRRDDDDEEEED
jgi:hypothetical protein